MTTVNRKDKFRPRADAGLLYKINEEAWQRKSDALRAEMEGGVGERLAQHLESLYPTADMVMLAKYGCTAEKARAHVRVRVPESDRWDESVGVEMGRAVTVASSYSGLSCGGVRYSEAEFKGVSPEAKAKMVSDQTWETFCADQADRDRRAVPVELEPFFFAVVRTRKEWQKDYKRLAAWPAEFKERTGAYPTWGEIEDEFPVIGKFLAEARATV